MAFHTPPEVLLRTVVRTMSSRLRNSQVGRPCHSSGKRFYRAVMCTKLGDPLEVKDVPLPAKVPDGKVLVATHAAGINFADILISQGKYQVQPKTPFIPGSELSGVVEAVGEGVKEWKKGDRVMALPANLGGGFGEYCLVDPIMAFPAPENLSLVEGAGFLVSYSTAMMALSRTAQLKEGETVLVTAAAGATGLAAVDIALNVFKAEVIGVCGGADKCALLRQRGVTHTIDYQTEDIKTRVKEITSGNGVNVVIDQVGGDLFTECLKSLAFEGRLITVGYASGTIPSVSVNKLLLKSCSIRGVWWGNYGLQDPAAFSQSIQQVLTAFTEGRLHPHIGKAFPLEEANAAFEHIMARRSTGKTVLKMREE
ncbi:quinone oxidoreductase-like protein 2 homolog isoform X1 [Babylonia areolata]|uniref:quinone oxidoreductase-like protein 2 homolog isoform X1 n=1 Tax=Babylonia areolata TaxID=304850 RepID=UPI003FD46B86